MCLNFKKQNSLHVTINGELLNCEAYHMTIIGELLDCAAGSYYM